MASVALTCRDCGSGLSDRNTSGFCARCVGRANLSRPGVKEKMSRVMRQRVAADPALRAKYQRQVARARSLRSKDAMRERWEREKPWIKGNACRPAGSPARIRAGQRLSETKLAWCPPHLRDEYKFLTKKKRFKAAEAREIIESQHEAEMLRWRRDNDPAYQPAPIPKDGGPKESIIASVLYETRVSRSDFMGKRRKAAFVRARQAAVFALRQYYGEEMSFDEIAKAVGREDHTTACHHYRAAHSKIDSDPEFAALVRKVSL